MEHRYTCVQGCGRGWDKPGPFTLHQRSCKHWRNHDQKMVKLRAKALARPSKKRRERLAEKVKDGQERVSVPTNMDQSFTHEGCQDATTSSLQAGTAHAILGSVESAIPPDELGEPQGSSGFPEPLPHCPD